MRKNMNEQKKIKGAIFDLDGVLVDTAKYHFLAWKKLADKLKINFTEKDNERLKGVSRTRSLEILLEIGGITATLSQKEIWADEKNDLYVDSLKTLDEKALLEGSLEYLNKLKDEGILIALGSASKNAPLILQQLKIENLFDAIIDGNCVSKAKPDPEVFLKGAQALKLKPFECAVFEDSLAGIEAAKAAGMMAIAVGTKENLSGADFYIKNLKEAEEKMLLLDD